jgi:tyrosine-protein kinase Etk/Wzc
MTNGERATRESTREDSPGDIHIVELLIVLAKHKKVVLGVPFVAVVFAALISFLLPSIYTGTTRIMPPQQNQASAAAAVLGQLGGLGGVAAGGLGLRNPADLYVGILKSQSIADPLIERFKLKELFGVETIDDARLELERITKITSGKDGIIVIEIEDKDPKRAADLANAYAEQLEKTNERLAVTEAAQRRLFFEKQLNQQQTALAAAEVELKKTQEKTGLIKLYEKGKSII